jgi:hypothetical protein
MWHSSVCWYELPLVLFKGVLIKLDLAPEIVAMGMPEIGQGEITGYDAAVDMWSLGVSLYFM